LGLISRPVVVLAVQAHKATVVRDLKVVPAAVAVVVLAQSLEGLQAV